MAHPATGGFSRSWVCCFFRPFWHKSSELKNVVHEKKTKNRQSCELADKFNTIRNHIVLINSWQGISHVGEIRTLQVYTDDLSWKLIGMMAFRTRSFLHLSDLAHIHDIMVLYVLYTAVHCTWFRTGTYTNRSLHHMICRAISVKPFGLSNMGARTPRWWRCATVSVVNRESKVVLFGRLFLGFGKNRNRALLHSLFRLTWETQTEKPTRFFVLVFFPVSYKDNAKIFISMKSPSGTHHYSPTAT